MKICFICDLHLPYHSSAVQYDLLDWALQDARKKQAGVIVFPGDFTANGHPDALRLFAEKIREFDLPVIVSPGNSDYRTPETSETVAAYETSPLTEIAGWNILALYDGHAAISEEVYALLDSIDDRTVVIGHHPPECLRGEHASRMTAWRTAHPTVPYFFGHLHLAAQRDDSTYLLNAADPDKAIDEMPAISYYDTDTRVLRKTYYNCPVPYDFARYIGLSCKNIDPDLTYAVGRNVPYLELRGEATRTENTILLPLLEQWRENGGKLLSLHAPAPLLEAGRFAEKKWATFIKIAQNVRADRITLHVPEISVTEATDERLMQIADFLAEKLSVLPEDFMIGIENMHMTEDESVEHHRFGYLPEECLRYVRLLREPLPNPVGMHLDVGHARNNSPFREKYTLAAWYEEVGAEINGYHIHQVGMKNGELENHQPIDNWYGRFISYASFFRAWDKGSLAKAPLFLEIRPDEGYRATFDLLDNEIPVFDLHSHTHYSFCGRDLPEVLIRTMIRNGVRLLGITDHNYGIGPRKAEYERVLRSFAAGYADRIRILCGIEIATLPPLYDLTSPAEIAGYDYCLLEHIDSPDSLAKDDPFGFAKMLGIRCGIAHTDLFAYCDNRGYGRRDFFQKLAEAGIFWELNVSYDSIHLYREHAYVADFINDPEKQAIIRECGVYVSVGFDGHRHEDYDGAKVAETVKFLKNAGIRTADELFSEK